MHIMESKPQIMGGVIRFSCPYCKGDFPVSTQVIYPLYGHNCPEAGAVFHMNGHLIVGVPNYLREEKEKFNNSKRGR